MNVHVSCKFTKTPDQEREINQLVEKLRRRLQVFRPELVHLHVGVEQNSAREGAGVSLNLRLPSGQMAASATSPNFVVALKSAFDDLLEQLAKHKDRLRAHGRWIRPREADRANPLEQVPFEQTLAAVKLPTVSQADVSSYVNANLYRLLRFIDRELRYREANGQLRAGLVAREEVVDETIATALGDGVDKPERLSRNPGCIGWRSMPWPNWRGVTPKMMWRFRYTRMPGNKTSVAATKPSCSTISPTNP